MAITKEKKTEVIDKVSELLKEARLTVLAQYSGLSVAEMQDLRKQARDNGVTITVAKNRLVKIAAEKAGLKIEDDSVLTGQILLAISPDEVAPAQVSANFAKKHPQLEMIAAITDEGKVLGRDEVKVLADLPSKDALRAQLVGTIAAPLQGFVGVLSGNLRSVINVLNARAKAIE